MAIPQSFKEKYSLTGESYEKRNVDLALSDLFAASTRLFADNSELRRQIDDLKAERNSLAAQLREAKAAPAPAPLSESSTTIRKLEEICLRLDALESKIGANAGVLGERLSAIAEALCDTAG
jgi:seryl-tRNA synthetase